MSRSPPAAITQLPLSDIDAVVFYKRDQLTIDLICCDVESRGLTWTFHEELAEWEEVIAHLSGLPHFKSDWYQAVVNPPFAVNHTVAYRRE